MRMKPSKRHSSTETRIQGACIIAERCVSRALTIVNKLQIFIYNLFRLTKMQQLRNDWLALLLQIGSISGLAVIALFLKTHLYLDQLAQRRDGCKGCGI